MPLRNGTQALLGSPCSAESHGPLPQHAPKARVVGRRSRGGRKGNTASAQFVRFVCAALQQ
jgi:hypothetical protein